MVTSQLMLGTDALIDLSRQCSLVVNWLDDISRNPLSNICGFSDMKFLYGVSNSNHLRKSRDVLNKFPIIWHSPDTMQRVFNDLVVLHLTNGVGKMDSLIASTALCLNFQMVSVNKRHYDAIPGLTIIQPYER